ncbi:MAG: YdcF family protein [Verrucomicrobiales bacterium]|nr:YdcF family protein [Verrucomicrobiales bacterium]
MSLRRFLPKRPVRLAVLCVGGLLAILLGSHGAIHLASRGRLYTDPDSVPPHRTALVLGCAKTLPTGRPNLYFSLRMRAAAALYDAGRVDYLIVSGDNHRTGYDEPTDMRDALIAAGVPADRIYRDYAGFRTLDSVIRAREVFGQEAYVIVSQRFHNQRALFIARSHGIDAVAFDAPDVARLGGRKTKVREVFARAKTVADVWLLNTKPRFLGPPVALGGPTN